MIKIYFFFLLNFILSVTTAKEIAITFDDAPRFAKGYLDGQTRAKKLIENLQQAKVPNTVFFSVSSNLNDEGKNRIQLYASAGYNIANHTDTHPNFNQVSAKDYINDFKTADKALSKFPNFVKWFRFPYLREGNNISKRDMMRNTLSKMKYFNAYITINNYDWYMEDQFQAEIAKKTNLNFEKLKKYYVSQLMNAVEYYDKMAVTNLGRSPKHVLLLHETDLNALFIGDLISELRNKGWDIITPQEAYKDQIAEYVTPKVLNFNPGRIGEIAKDKGQTTGLWHESCDEVFLDNEFQKTVLK